jgi:PAS domain S-box-containing protein
MRSQWRRYALALVAVLLAVAVRVLLNPMLAQEGVAVFLLAALITAWLGGIGPAFASLVLLHAVHGYGFQDPPRMWEGDLASVITTVLYYLLVVMVGFLSQARGAAVRSARDEHVEAVSQREQLHTTLSCMADGVLVTDVDGRLTLLNPTAEAMTGWSMADAAGKPWWEVLSIRRDDGQQDVESPIERVLHERCVVHEKMPLVLTSRTGRVIPIAYSAAPIRHADGQTTGVVLIFRDESERRRTELALRNADRRKDNFLATLAHELRNPLAPIAMGLELLDLSADDPQSTAEIRAMMQRQTQHMVRLIDDLLDVSRITRGKLELRRGQIAIADVVRNAVEAAQPLIEENRHELTVDLPDRPLLMYADANRLTQVVTNLLNNAAKFTPREGRISLVAENAGSDVVLTVSDSGIGVPADKIDYIFDMFAQINDGSDSGRAGLGIGLTLAKRLVEMHGGSIEAQSRGKNLGTTFRLRLPALPEPERPSPHRDAPQRRDLSRSPKRRVLIVDDNADALESLCRLVSLMGNDVRRAHDGLEALEVARTFRPDIVLMDLGMPNLSGFEAARRMRQEPWGGGLSLVATTGWGQDDDRRRTAEAGFDRHLVKPIAVDSLREVLSDFAAPRGRKPTHAADAAET